MRGIRGYYAAAGLGLALAGCAAQKQEADSPGGSSGGLPPAESEPHGEMDVGVSFSDPAAGSATDDDAEAPARHEPPPTQTYSPANKLSPEEKAAAGAP